MLTAHDTVRSANQGQPSPVIRIYNTLSKAKEVFQPLSPPSVGIYLCGPTVYKPCHIGHMVGPVIFDTVKRYLSYCGYRVTLVINITDIDDKLIVESQRRGMTVAQLAEEVTADYMANLLAMGVDTVDHFPRAAAHIDEIIRFTEALVAREFAYVADGGDVYFDVAKDREYGKLSHRELESMQGEGGDMRERKRSLADFALWKGAKPDEPSWPSPWGNGRPGWHIECSAMSRRLLGESFDIHGGGLDLVFPHHENEIAQSECCHGKPQAKYWMHNGLMQAADEVGKVGGRNTRSADEPDALAQAAGKLAKSKGASPLAELLKRFSPETIRLFLLSSHYRRPIYFSEDRIREAETSLDTFYRFFQRYERIVGESFYSLVPRASRGADLATSAEADSAAVEIFDAHRRRFLEAMDDDFNTGGAIGDLFELVRALNKHVDMARLEEAAANTPKNRATLQYGTAVLRELAAVLGLFRVPVRDSGSDDALVEDLLKLLVAMRGEARQAKNFALADRIRTGLAELSVTLEDRPGGTVWTIQRSATPSRTGST